MYRTHGLIEAIAVVVPARDEEDSIGACIAALEGAQAHVAPQVETFLVLVLDSCRDRSRIMAMRELQQPHRVLEVSYRNVGQARAHGARVAIQRFAAFDPNRVWLATTDADSRVSRRWLADHIAAADGGADALAGTVRVDDWRGFSPTQVQAFQRSYAARECSAAHPHVHGANLGVRADAYLEVGGFAALTTGEDDALWNALRGRGRRMVSARSVEVATSSRLHGRAPHGFAGYLAEHCRRVT